MLVVTIGLYTRCRFQQCPSKLLCTKAYSNGIVQRQMPLYATHQYHLLMKHMGSYEISTSTVFINLKYKFQI
uniref:Uncharacterized protein n=1 Tax=Anguilla anguilla TaxID=7936 RepID=A0A0E9XNZ6_ANGAN